jgi:hypothetical protein
MAIFHIALYHNHLSLWFYMIFPDKFFVLLQTYSCGRISSKSYVVPWTGETTQSSEGVMTTDIKIIRSKKKWPENIKYLFLSKKIDISSRMTIV